MASNDDAILSVLTVVYDFCATAYQEAIIKGDADATQAFQIEMKRLDCEMKTLEVC